MKSWLITTTAPFVGTDQYYCVFSEKDPSEIKEVIDWFWDYETQHLWEMFGYKWEDNFDEEFEEDRDIYSDYDDFIDAKMQEWSEQCNMVVEEMSPEELQDYIPGGPKSENDLPEIIYDER